MKVTTALLLSAAIIAGIAFALWSRGHNVRTLTDAIEREVKSTKKEKCVGYLLMNRSRAFWKCGQYYESYRDCEMAAKLVPHRWEPQAGMAAYVYRGSPKTAEGYRQAAVRLGMQDMPDSPEPFDGPSTDGNWTGSQHYPNHDVLELGKYDLRSSWLTIGS